MRCQAANANFIKLGHDNLTVERAYNEVLNVWPNLNQISIHSSIMVPSQGRFQSQPVWGFNHSMPLATDF